MSKPSKKKKNRWTKNDTELTVMALPTTVWYILFSFLPMFGLIIAFKNYKITGGKSFIYNLLHSDWAGFKNFSFLIRSNDLFVILRNTILYNLAFIALGMVFSVGLAIMISLLHNKRASKVYQTMMFFPYFMSWVVASYFLDAFLNQDNGLINSILRNAGKEPIQWYMSAGVWPFILCQNRQNIVPNLYCQFFVRQQSCDTKLCSRRKDALHTADRNLTLRFSLKLICHRSCHFITHGI